MSGTSSRWIAGLSVTLVAAVATLGSGFAAGPPGSQGTHPDPDAVTFAEDVAPILHENCVSCHRPGEVGPMSLRTYEEVRPWAPVIREQVAERIMPPWHADPAYGEFANDRRLADDEVEAILRWVDAGAAEGDPAKAPPLPEFPEGWTIGEPDVVLAMQEAFPVPAEGVIDYQRFRVPTNFEEDKYVVAAEVRPGDRGVVHHVIVSVIGPDDATHSPGQRDPSLSQDGRLGGMTPGQDPRVLRPGVAQRVPAGSELEFEMHYTTNGEATTDRTRIGLVFADGPVERLVRTRIAIQTNLDIPPYEPNYRATAGFEFPYDVHIESLRPHMHDRGKDMRYTLLRPDGTEEVLLFVPNFDFNWQTNYELAEPVFAPEGSRIEVVAHWDNSEDNPSNPDPSARVRWGPQSWDEMLVGWLEYTRADESAVPSP